MSSEETNSTTSNEVPIISGTVLNNNTINFKELKKQLKGIEKLSEKNLDIRSWKSDLKLWMKLQKIEDPEIIYTACILTSSGQIREIIEELEEGNDSENEDSDDEEESKEENKYPTLDKVVDAVETFYGLKEDQNIILRDIRALRIKKNERVKDFNIRYRSLYLKLDKKKKKQISVLDYAESLQNNKEAWKKVSLKGDISLNKAFKIAEKVDRLFTRYDDNREYSNYYSQNKYNRNFQSYSKKSYETKEPQKVKKDEIEDLTKRMKNLSIHTCFFCLEKGHNQLNCPKLQEIISAN
eukprot:jgi/Orpsp1_1/1190831/evm.model.d7180000081504.1